MLVKYKDIWDKIKELIGKNLYGEFIHRDKYIKTKVKLLNGIIHTNLHISKIPKENVDYACLALITIDSIIKMDSKYFP